MFAERGVNVWFISPEPLQELPDNMRSTDKDILKLITFLYLKDQKELLSYTNSIHTWHTMPLVLLINQFEFYVELSSPDYNPGKAAFIAASLLDAAATCGRKHAANAFLITTCKVNAEDGDRLQQLVNFYFSNTFSTSTFEELVNIINENTF